MTHPLLALDLATAYIDNKADSTLLAVLRQADYSIQVWRAQVFQSCGYHRDLLNVRIHHSMALINHCIYHRDTRRPSALYSLELYRFWLDVLADKKVNWRPMVDASRMAGQERAIRWRT